MIALEVPIRRGVGIAVLVLSTLTFATAQTGSLQIAVDQSPVGLDPHLATAFSTFVVVGQVYDALVELNSDLQVEPALASSWHLSDDGLEYVFTLRDGIRFHNGREMTSADVAYSYERVMAEETGSPFASRFTLVDRIETPDDRTVVFVLTEASAPFLSNLVDLTVVPREVVEEHGDLQRVAVGTGPFQFVEWIPDTRIVLAANPAYYRSGEPGVAELVYHIVPDASTRTAGLRTGAYHMLPDVAPAAALTLEGAAGVTLLRVPDLAASRFGLNVEHPALADARVRRAINLALDRDEIVEAVFYGNGAPGGVVSPALTDWAVMPDELTCYSHDPDASRRLLADAGFSDGFDMRIISFSTMSVVRDMAQVLQAQLAAVGIRSELDFQEFGAFVQNWRNSEFDGFVSQAAGAIDPDTVLYRHFHSAGSANVYNFADERVDALLDEGQVALDPERRRAIYEELQHLLSCEGPAITPGYGTLFTAVRDSVEGFHQVPTRSLRYLRNVVLQ